VALVNEERKILVFPESGSTQDFSFCIWPSLYHFNELKISALGNFSSIGLKKALLFTT
jgi:hypothetical protein